MKALVQRVTEASVSVDKENIGQIGKGLLVLLGVEKGDDEVIAERMVDRILAYRIFADDSGRMNLSVKDIAASVLVVSQFTLVADTHKGLRPGFSKAADPAKAEHLYHCVVDSIIKKNITTASGRFAADMQVALVNDGPVTFMLEVTV